MKKSNEIFASADFPVIVARSKNSREDTKVRTFKCKDSGVTVISNYLAKPYSPITGGKLVPQDKKLLTLTASEVDHLESLGTCPSCGAELLAHKTVASSIENATLHCVVCGEELQVEETGNPVEFLEKIAENYEDADANSTAYEPQTTQMVESEAFEDGGEENGTATMEDNTSEEGAPAENFGTETSQMEPVEAEACPECGEEPCSCPEEDKPVESEAEEEAPVESEEPAEEIAPEEIPSEEEAPAEEAPAEEMEAPEVESEAEAEEEAPAEEPAPAEVPMDEEIRVDMLSRCEAGLNSKSLNIVESGSNNFHYVMVANKPVATLHKSRAIAEVQDYFDNRNILAQLLTASIEKQGLCKNVISSFGLVPMVLKVKANEVIKAALDEKLDEQTTQMQLKEEALEDEYQQSLGIAAVAVNKNLFDDTKNVLAEDLIDSFEEIGVEDARDIVESSFKRCGEEYLRTIVAKAAEFKGKSADVRNELANTVMASSFQSKKSSLGNPVVASTKESLTDEEVNKYRSLFHK